MREVKGEFEGRLAALLSDVSREIDISRSNRVYCNRNLKMGTIETVGFDMDYTLARYRQETIDALSLELTTAKMVENLGYPEEIKSLDYDPQLAIRGLVVDTKFGNVLKMDRHAHVGRAYHGFRRLSDEERRSHYRDRRIRLHLPRYAWVDTLFALPEAVAYMTLVDYFDRKGHGPSYEQLYADIRKSIDMAHADGSLKTIIKANLSEYFARDEKLAETLHKLRSSGKKIFLLTNSYYTYTNAVMSFLLDGMRAAYPTWRNYFDVKIVGGQKPAFFNDRNPFLEVDEDTGEATDAKVTGLSRSKVYQGGNIFDFERMTGMKGDNVLYVGDHIYGDILRLKKSHVWRTAMVVQELELENRTGERLAERIKDLGLLDRRRRNLDSEIDYQVLLLKSLQRFADECSEQGNDAVRARVDRHAREAKEELDRLRNRMRVIAEDVDSLEQSIDRAYNPYWGASFREGNENSRFGEQVSDYADLYTSRVSNFLHYSPLRYFRAPRRQMPHEL